jgi:hypothetical protein
VLIEAHARFQLPEIRRSGKRTEADTEVKRSYLAVLIVLVFLGIAQTANAQKPSKPNIKHPEQQATPQNSHADSTNDQRGTEKSPISVKLLNTGKSAAETTQEAQQIEEQNNTNWWIVRLTIAAVGVGVLQLVAFIVQAGVLLKTITAMRENAKQDLRAYVDAINVSMVCPTLDIPNYVAGPGMQHDALFVTFLNTGKTPARKVLVHASCVTIEGYRTELPGDFSYPDVPKAKSIPSVSSIIPNTPTRTDGFETIDLVGVKRARKREATVYIYGHADYFDVFGDPHITPFCYEFMPETPNAAFRAYKEHNNPD